MKTANTRKTKKSKVVPVHPVTSTTNKKAKKTQPITHEMIARRAEAIWKSNGCLPGRDEQNWYQAERELATQGQER